MSHSWFDDFCLVCGWPIDRCVCDEERSVFEAAAASGFPPADEEQEEELLQKAGAR